jgi:hypothetical protein
MRAAEHIIYAVMAGLVPAIPGRGSQCLPERDVRLKAGHDGSESSMAIFTHMKA